MWTLSTIANLGFSFAVNMQLPVDLNQRKQIKSRLVSCLACAKLIDSRLLKFAVEES